MGPRADELRLADNMTGDATVPQTTDDPAGRPGDHPRRQQHHHRGDALRQADGRCCRSSGTSTTTPSGCTSSGYGVRLATYAFTDDELLGAVDRLLADTDLRERMAAIGADIRARDGLRRGAEIIERVGLEHRSRRWLRRVLCARLETTSSSTGRTRSGSSPADTGHRAEPVTCVRRRLGRGRRRATVRDSPSCSRLRSRMAVEDGFRVTMHAWVAPDDESERAMGVDQTHESWVVGGTVGREVGDRALVGTHPAADRLRRLADAGFAESPAPGGAGRVARARHRSLGAGGRRAGPTCPGPRTAGPGPLTRRGEPSGSSPARRRGLRGPTSAA